MTRHVIQNSSSKMIKVVYAMAQQLKKRKKKKEKKKPHLPMQDTQVWSLSRENPLEKEIACHSRILAWRIPWTEEPGGSQRVRHNFVTQQQQPQAHPRGKTSEPSPTQTPLSPQPSSNQWRGTPFSCPCEVHADEERGLCVPSTLQRVLI